ncbi:hypothetical protein D3C83_183410 [compost metagenome]
MLRIDAEQMRFQDAKEPDQTFDGLGRLLAVRQRLDEGHEGSIRRLRHVRPGA